MHTHAAGATPALRPPGSLEDLKELARKIVARPTDSFLDGTFALFDSALKQQVELIDNNLSYWLPVIRQLDPEHFASNSADGETIRVRLEDAGFVEAALKVASLQDPNQVRLVKLCEALIEF